ncbi:hypothetical protein [Petrachloros mirabilis]
MTGVKNQIGFIGFSALGLTMVITLQVHLGQWKTASNKLEHLMYIPDAQYLQMASLGHQEIVADVLWLQAIQVMAGKNISDEAGHWLYRAFDVITTLDPHFVRAYEAGALALTTFVVLPEESNRLLMKGMEHNPREWKLPFYLGINYYFELYDDAKAAEYIAQASRLPGAPIGLVPMAANLFAAAKSPQQAVDILILAYQNTADQSAKKLLEIRLKMMLTERDLVMLEQAIGLYQSLHRRLPDRLEDLVAVGLLSGLPKEPAGGRYLYEPTTGAVSSSEMPERPKLTGKRRIR